MKDDDMRPAEKATLEERAAALLLVSMVFMVAAHVASRYVLHKSLSHTEELVRYFFVWSTFLGVSAAVARKRHLAIQGLARFLPRQAQTALSAIKTGGALMFSALILFFGARIIILQWQTSQLTAALGLPMWLFGLAVPVSAAFVLYRIVRLVAKAGISPNGGVSSQADKRKANN